MKCLQCQSERIIEKVRVVDKGEGNWKGDLTLEVYENPDAWVFKGPKEGKVHANVCVDCGHVMFGISLLDARKLERYKKK